MREITQEGAVARFYKFVSFRNKFCLWLSLVILVCYYGFVASVGFFPEVLGYRLGPSTLRLGLFWGFLLLGLLLLAQGFIRFLLINILIKNKHKLLKIYKKVARLKL